MLRNNCRLSIDANPKGKFRTNRHVEIDQSNFDTTQILASAWLQEW